MTTIAEKQQRTANWLISELTDAPPANARLWNLRGDMGSGKSRVLRMVWEELKSEGETIPVLVVAPPGEVDAAPVALLEIASQLQDAGLVNGGMTVISDPTRPWREKMEALADVVRHHEMEVVLLCDEPLYWYQGQDSLLDDTPDDCARILAEWLVGETNCRRIISGRLPGDVPPRPSTRAPRLDDGVTLLDDASQWGQAAPIARELRSAIARPLDHCLVWQVKLLVALSRFKLPRDVARQAVSNNAASVLLEEFLDLSERDSSATSICYSLARLTLARTPIARATFDAITRDVSAGDRSLIETCLCEQIGGELALHPFVRQEIQKRTRDPRRWERRNAWRLAENERKAVHRSLGSTYTSGRTTLRSQLESLRHDVLSDVADVAATDGRLRFVEQLHEIGRTLSYVHREHARAVEVFRMALQLDSSIAYTHHYLAFNLDWLASRPDEVELHYREAIRLQSDHPWWWSRWVCYLATRGRFREARDAWREALDELSLGYDESSRWLYLSLHRWVARWLLHWSELDFAEDVLRSIPAEVANAEASVQTLWDLLHALRAAERGKTVFPLSVPAREWASPVPHTDLPNALEEGPLREWLPARVEYLDADAEQAHLLAGRRTGGMEDPSPDMELSLSKAEVESAAIGFRWNQLGAGRFLELGYYGDERVLRISMHKNTAWWSPHLLPLVPPPNRWYERAVSESWTESQGE